MQSRECRIDDRCISNKDRGQTRLPLPLSSSGRLNYKDLNFWEKARNITDSSELSRLFELRRWLDPSVPYIPTIEDQGSQCSNRSLHQWALTYIREKQYPKIQHEHQPQVFEAGSMTKFVFTQSKNTWNSKQVSTVISKVRVFLNDCLRKILNVRWSDTTINNVLWEKTNQLRAEEEEIRKKRRKAIRHILRKSPDCTDGQAFTWDQEGKRKRGGPKNIVS